MVSPSDGVSDEKLAASELVDLIPRVLQSLHTNAVWESVTSAEEISCVQFKEMPRPWVLLLTPKNGQESPIALKYESKIGENGKLYKIEPRTVETQKILSDHGLGITLLAFSRNDDEEPNFTCESVGKPCFDMTSETEWDIMNGENGAGGVMAKLAARLHKRITVEWFDKYRGEVLELCPLMKNEPDNSQLWIMMRSDALNEARLGAKAAKTQSQESLVGETPKKAFLNQQRAYAPTDDDMKRLVAVLPRPRGEFASRAVTCHGDLWAANVIMQGEEGRLIDFEGMTVSCACAELAQFGDDRAVSKVYLQELMKREGEIDGEDHRVPTEEEIDQFWFEVLIASHVAGDILRPTCWPWCAEDWTDTSMNEMIAHTEKFSTHVHKLSKNWDLALQILRKSSEGSEMDWWCCDKVMDSILQLSAKRQMRSKLCTTA